MLLKHYKIQHTCREDLVATRLKTALGVTKALAPMAPRARAATADFMVS